MVPTVDDSTYGGGAAAGEARRPSATHRLLMPIYFPRGFNSGEPVRVVDGVTVVRGSLMKQSAALRVVGGARGPLGGVAGPGRLGVRRVLRAAGTGLERRLRALPRDPGSLHVFDPRDRLGPALGFFELRELPRTAAPLTEVLEVIERAATERSAREVAIAPFGPEATDAALVVRVIGERIRRGASAIRWIVVVGDRAQFEAATSGVFLPTSP